MQNDHLYFLHLFLQERVMTKTKSKPSSRPKLQSHFKVEEVAMKPLNETLPNSRSDSSVQPSQPMLYYDIDLANIQREDRAKKARIQPTGPTAIGSEELTYPPVSHCKSFYSFITGIFSCWPLPTDGSFRNRFYIFSACFNVQSFQVSLFLLWPFT